MVIAMGDELTSLFCMRAIRGRASSLKPA
jgi:hypothetical protein